MRNVIGYIAVGLIAIGAAGYVLTPIALAVRATLKLLALTLG